MVTVPHVAKKHLPYGGALPKNVYAVEPVPLVAVVARQKVVALFKQTVSTVVCRVANAVLLFRVPNAYSLGVTRPPKVNGKQLPNLRTCLLKPLHTWTQSAISVRRTLGARYKRRVAVTKTGRVLVRHDAYVVAVFGVLYGLFLDVYVATRRLFAIYFGSLARCFGAFARVFV